MIDGEEAHAISQPYIEHYWRDGDYWALNSPESMDANLHLSSLEIDIPLTDIFRNIVSVTSILQMRRDDILRVAAQHGAHNVRVFGSVARGEATPESDLDFLVDLEPGKNLLDLGGLLMALRTLLDCKVDVITVKGLRPRIRERVLREAVPL